MESNDATSPIQEKTTQVLPENWGKRVADWKPGKDAPEGTHVRNGMLIVEGTKTPPAPESIIKPVAAVEEPHLIDTPTIATIPDELPPGGLDLYTNFVQGGPNPNLVNKPLIDQVAKRNDIPQQVSPSPFSRIKERLGAVTGRFSSQPQTKNYNPYSGD
jgi:hypothetical protein